MRSLILALPALILTTPASAQLPQVDPRAPASCDIPDGWIVVMKDWLTALDRATQANALLDPAAGDLARWFGEAEARILKGENVEDLCREALALRTQHGF